MYIRLGFQDYQSLLEDFTEKFNSRYLQILLCVYILTMVVFRIVKKMTLSYVGLYVHGTIYIFYGGMSLACVIKLYLSIHQLIAMTILSIINHLCNIKSHASHEI